MKIKHQIGRWVSYIRMIFCGALIIEYEKVDKPSKTRANHTDIETIAERYENSLKSNNLYTLLSDLSVKDNFYFIEKECRNCIKKKKNNFTILDVGCGSGIYSKIFGRKGSIFEGAKYIGTEINEKLTGISKKYLPKHDFLLSYADNIALKKDSVDLAFCSSTLHYTLDDWKKSLLEFTRVSKKYIALTRFPVTKYNKTFYVHQTVRGKSGAEDHFFIVINREELEEHFKNNGMKILKRDYSSQEYDVKGIDERIVLIQYLLEKK